MIYRLTAIFSKGVSSTKTENENLEKKISNYREKILELTELVNDLKLEKERFKKQCDSLQNELEILHRENSNLSKQFILANEKVKKLYFNILFYW